VIVIVGAFRVIGETPPPAEVTASGMLVFFVSGFVAGSAVH
jgi:hypothetical protein